MALKILEAHVSKDLAGEAESALRDVAQDVWVETGGAFDVVIRAVVGADRTGSAMDLLHERVSQGGRLRVLIQPLDAVLPRPLATDRKEQRHEARSAAAVSREEVYASIAGSAALTPTYVALVILASIVAAIGLSKNNTAAVIGAMVVAPLLGPNMALALGLVLGDGPLVRRSLRTNSIGLAVSFCSAAVLGSALSADPSIPEIASRTRVDVGDLVLALAAGCAGTLSYTAGAPTYLTGVMVAVALLPPAVASGLLIGDGELKGALAALLLAGANVTALTLAAMLTFLWKNMRPRYWWQEQRARRSARLGLVVFLALFSLLTGIIITSRRYFEG